jgi:hypothetical protein
MVVDFNYHKFIVIFNERDSVPPEIEKYFKKRSIGSAHCKFPLEVILHWPGSPPSLLRGKVRIPSRSTRKVCDVPSWFRDSE